MSSNYVSMSEDPANDLDLVQAMADELDNYLIDNELYRTVIAPTAGRGDQRINMTGGELLTRLHRLQATRDQLAPADQERLDRVASQVRDGIKGLRTRFHSRLQQEVKSRLNSLRWFLDSCAQDRRSCRSEYPFEIRNRQRVEEAVKEMGTLPEELAGELATVDRRIRAVARPSEFVWSDSLSDVFPRDPYWFLYMLPQEG